MRGPRIVSERPGFDPAPAGEVLAPPASTASDTAWRLRLALVWGGAGFAAGATFWHLVGFWAFLSEGVLDRAPEAHAALASTAAPVVLVDANRCTSLTLDRRAKETLAHPCPGNGLALRTGSDRDERGDMVAEQPTGDRAD